MDLNKLLSGVECACGKHHTCDIDYVYIEDGAISHLADILAKNKNILIVADENTYGAAGDKVMAALAGKNIKKVIFSGKTVLIPNEQSVARVNEDLCGIDMIVGIGSGVIQDLCKYVSFESGIPYLVIATAPSMDGYASDGAAMIWGGMKATFKAGLPRAIIADTAVLASAPMEMIKAGYGDIVGKYSALNDWKLSKCVNGEYFCDYIYSLTYDMIIKTLSVADGLLKRDKDSLKVLFEALVAVGILMSFAGSSRPASGSEHHLSHFFEIVGIQNGEEYFPHGIDVAYSTVITAAIREKLVNTVFPERIVREDEAALEANIKRIYTASADGCIALQKKVGNYALDRSEIYKSKEEEIKAILREVPPSKEIEAMLARVELDMSKFYNLYSEKKIAEAVKYAKDLKDRYTVLWLNYDFGF